MCKRDYTCYRKLGDHRRHYHKLPFRQERLGNNGELSSHDLHPDKKNHMAPTEDSVNQPLYLYLDEDLTNITLAGVRL